LLKPLLALALLTVSAAGLAQAPALQPASPAEIVAAASTCFASAKPGMIDASVLTGQGWAKGEASDKSGKTIDLPFDFYGRKGSKVMIMAKNADGNGMCSVLARVDRIETSSAVAQALSARFRKKPFKADKEGVFWLSERRIVQLAATGDRAKPSVRISVMQQIEKK
jgi:hypothetical protein